MRRSTLAFWFAVLLPPILPAAPAMAQMGATPDNAGKLTLDALTATPQRQARLPLNPHAPPVRDAYQRERHGYARGYVGNHSSGNGRRHLSGHAPVRAPGRAGSHAPGRAPGKAPASGRTRRY